jgi:hypothetical protein
MTRIDACTDKLALLVWAFYCPFNPEKRSEVLDYQKIMERLRSPVKFGLTLKGTRDFIKCLEQLTGPHFNRIKIYRNHKIHRREPRIELYGVGPHHDWPYMLPLTDSKEIEQWTAKLAQQYPDTDMRTRIEKSCYIRGVLFNSSSLSDRLWDYTELHPQIEKCLLALLEATGGCFRILRRRLPLRDRK